MRRFAILTVAVCGLTQLVSFDAKAEPKIGYVDMARALNDVEDGKKAKARFESEFEQKQKKLDKLKTDLKSKTEDFEKRAALMTDEAKQAKQEELQRDYLEAHKYHNQLQQEFDETRIKLAEEIGGKLRSVIEKIGDKDGHLLILNIGDVVLYSKRHMDLTDDAIRDYNKQYGKK